MTGSLVACFCAAARLLSLSSSFSSFTPEEGKMVQGDMFLGAIAGYVPPSLPSPLRSEADLSPSSSLRRVGRPDAVSSP